MVLLVLLGPHISRALGEPQAQRAQAVTEHQSLAPLGETAAPAQKTYPAPDLIDDCQKEANRLRGRLDEGFQIRIEPPFIIASDLPRKEMDGYVNANLLGPARAMWATYFNARPDRVITVQIGRAHV